MTVTVLEGDSRTVLATLPEASIQCCVTSPPYFGLRDYGHDGQIGLEPTPDAYVAEIVAVFREVRRVLKDDGTLWLNLGDSYAASPTGNFGSKSKLNGIDGEKYRETIAKGHETRRGTMGMGVLEKNLLGIPWRVAFALQADGWYLRSDIIWHKPNPMPESVTDRPTKAHEYVFLLTKSARYYYDAAAIAEEATGRDPGNVLPNKHVGQPMSETKSNLSAIGPHDIRNARSVWTIATKPFKGAHFATMPPELAQRCILAGSRTAGKRCDCDSRHLTPTGSGSSEDPTLTTGRKGMDRERRQDEGRRPVTRRQQRHHAAELQGSPFRSQMEAVVGSAFAHYIRTDASGARPLPPEIMEDWTRRGWITEAPPCACPVQETDTVLDPFGGAGTTGLVADRLGRDATLIELNPTYAALARQRITDDAPMFAEVA